MPLVEYIDFVPSLLETEVPFSTLSLTGASGGPVYESFSAIIQKANEWLQTSSGIALLHVEVLEVSGVYSCESSPKSWRKKFNQKKQSGSDSALRAFLKTIRVWYTRSSSSNDTGVCQLQYVHLIPSRMESHPRAFNPKFQSLMTTLEAFNDSLQTEAAYIKGYRDFVGKIVSSGGRIKSSKCDNMFMVMEQMRNWYSTNAFRLVNIQTIDHSAYYHCAIDNPGYEDRTLTNPHYRCSVSGQQHCAKVLRVYFCSCQTCLVTLPCNADLRRRQQLVHKSFWTCRSSPVSLYHINFAKPNADVHSRVETSALQEINSWLEKSDDQTFVAIETLKLGVVDARKRFGCRRLAADETRFTSVYSPTAGTVYAVRLYQFSDALSSISGGGDRTSCAHCTIL